MRAVAVASFAVVAAIASLVACTQEEFPNPPATRNGTEDTQQSSGAALPQPSDPNAKPPTSSATSSTSSSSGAEDSGPPALPNGPTSGVDQSKTLGELSATEKKQFCDWTAGINGGYNKSTSCGTTTISGPKSQAACVQKLPPACAATVAEAEACLKIDAADPCAFALFKAPECEPIRNCSK
jgi:hypothetical protein